MQADTDFTTAYKKQAELQKQANVLNKTAVFDALESAGITRVVVAFDGEGDSGQIQESTAYKDKSQVEIATLNIHWQSVPWKVTEPESTDIDLQQAIEDLCWNYLSDEHGGWENNDGGYGEFTLDVSKREIDLDFYSRYTETAHYSHTF